jgi:phosphate transport system protein
MAERHFHEEVIELKQLLFRMGGLVEESVQNAIVSLVTEDNQRADRVFNAEDLINGMEIEIEELCLKLLALQQPLASDLRFITATMKINNDLERMGDHAVNIAGCVKKLNRAKSVKLMNHLPKMTEITRSMVRDGLESFILGDIQKAYAVCRRDDEVDKLDDLMFRDVVFYLGGNRKTAESGMKLMLISKNLERIADLSTNIAEEVIFIVQAKNIKHRQGIKKKKHKDMRSK